MVTAWAPGIGRAPPQSDAPSTAPPGAEIKRQYTRATMFTSANLPCDAFSAGRRSHGQGSVRTTTASAAGWAAQHRLHTDQYLKCLQDPIQIIVGVVQVERDTGRAGAHGSPNTRPVQRFSRVGDWDRDDRRLSGW